MPRTIALMLGLTLTVAACASEPPPEPARPPAPPPAAKSEPVPLRQDGRAHNTATTALTESLRAGLIRAQEALRAGSIDAAAYERIMLSHQRTIATMAAIEALGWGQYPPPSGPPPSGAAPGYRPPTRVEAIERLTEMMYRPTEAEAKPRANPRR